MTHDELRSLVEIKKDDLLNLCSDIIRIPSVNPPGDTDEMVQFICDYLKSHNIEYEIASGDGKTKNILARLGKKGGRVLILNGHCDVVPVGNLDRWDFDPFCGDIKDGKILVADPASYDRSSMEWDLSIILNEASTHAGAGGPFWIIG